MSYNTWLPFFIDLYLYKKGQYVFTIKPFKCIHHFLYKSLKTRNKAKPDDIFAIISENRK